MSPQASIIIPCYNIAPHVGKCVESILNQSFQDFELLLIDDGSTDPTLTVCKEYEKKDRRIKVYTHSNKGVSYTRNRGIELAKNELLMFIDGDDYIKPDYLETLINGYEERSWSISGMINVKGGIKKKNKYYLGLLRHYSDNTVRKRNLMDIMKFYSLSSPCARVYSKAIILNNRIKFDEDLTYQEDLLFNLQYVKYIDSVKLLDYYGYYYIEHTTSSSARFHEIFNHIGQLYNELKKYVNSENDKETLQEFILQTCLRKISNIFHSNSSKTKKQKLEELYEMFNSDSYNFAKRHIDKLKINFILRLILKLKSEYLIFLYFKVLHVKNEK